MNQELDDDIVDIQAPESEQEDDIVDIVPPESFGEKVASKASESATPLYDTIGNINEYVGETAQDFGTGMAKGLTMGALDELTGLVGAGVESGLGALGVGPAAADKEVARRLGTEPESFLEKYRGYQQAAEQYGDEAAKRSPIAETIGQVGGGITSAAGLGGMLGLQKAAVQGPKALLGQVAQNQGMGKAALDLLRGTATTGSRVADLGAKGLTTAATLAPAIAAESALTSKAQLVGEDANPEAVAADVLGGLSFGIPAALGLGSAIDTVGPRASQKVEEITKKIGQEFQDEGNPRLRQIARAYEHYGKDLGISPRSHGQDIAGQKFSQRDEKEATQLWNMFTTADKQLGTEVGASLEQATQRGVLLDVTPEIQGAAQRLMSLATELPQIAESAKASQAYSKVLRAGQQLTPTELKHLIDDLDFSIESFKKSTQLRPGETNVVPELMSIRKQLSDNLKKNVTEYRDAAERFESFRNLKEQLISGARPADVTGVYYGKLNNPDQKEYDRLLDMIQHVQRSAQSSSPERTAFTNFMDAVQQFQGQDLQRMAQGQKIKPVIPAASEIRKTILKASDDSVLRGSVRETSPERGIVPNLKEWVLGKAPASGAYLAGRIVKGSDKLAQKPIVQRTAAMTKAIYNAPAQSLSNLASKLESSGQFGPLGKSLRESLEEGNSAKKNAALFTIMQNPNSRAFISAEDFPDTEE